MCEMCMVFHGFSRFSKSRRFCERQGDRYSPSPSFADGMAPSNIIKTGFQHNPHAAVDPKSDPKNIRGCSSNGRALASHNVLFPREQTFFFFPFFFAGRKETQSRKTAEHTSHTHPPPPPRETRRDETRRDACARVRCNRRGRSRPSRFSSATWFSPPPAAAAAAHSQLHPCSILRSPPLYPPTLRRP